MNLSLLTLLLGISSVPSVPSLPIEAPVGGKSFALPSGTLCQPEPEGWARSPDGLTVRAPASAGFAGTVSMATVAESNEKCGQDGWSQKLVATAPWPAFDAAGTVAWVDEGRLEVKGTNLKGVTVHWKSGDHEGSDVCIDPRSDAGIERCSLAIGRGLSADPGSLTLSWRPAGALDVPGAIFFDSAGNRASPEAFRLRVARIVINPPLADTTSVEMLDGVGRVPATHLEGVAAVDCGAFHCEPGDGVILVYPGASLASSVAIRLRLAPKVFMVKGDAMESLRTVSIPLTRCSVAFASGEPLRHVDGTRVIMRLGARCSNEISALRWFANGDAVEVNRVEKDRGDAFVVLRVGRLDSERLTVAVAREEAERSVLASVATNTRPAPQVLATLEIPGHGPIEFIPKNREATVHIAGSEANLVVLPTPGIYSVRRDPAGTYVKGEALASGLVPLRFGYRSKGLPAGLDDVDLAVVPEPVFRAIREASVPVDFSAKAGDQNPLVELLCGNKGSQQRMEQGKTLQIPFSDRDSCRLVIHRERLKPEDGTQSITVEADVSKPDGDSRSGGHVSEHMLLRPGSASHTMWFHGVKHPFDRLVVRVSHRTDENLYLNESGPHHDSTEAQWSVVAGSGRFRFYATATIPTGLYRVNAPNSILSLNFGVLSRLVPLTREGQESLIGIEAGAMGVNLAGVSNYPSTLALVAGLGVSLPLGSRGEVTQSSVSLHAWAAREFRNAACTSGSLSPGDPGCTLASHWAFIFGPSISIGDIGANF